MEGGSLFNPGFLGSSFLWWVGQIADDSVWRDNINSGNYEDVESVPGWGRRYKVRIIGLHDQGEVEIPSEKLPWANVMYPITAGGFQTNSGGNTTTSSRKHGVWILPRWAGSTSSCHHGNSWQQFSNTIIANHW